MDNLNIDLIRTFLIVSRLRSFSRASNYLYIDQSTVSKKIRQLEEWYGTPLFVRTARGVEPTIAGRNFAQHANQLLADFTALRQPAPLDWSGLRVGAFDNIAAYLFPDFFARHLADLNQLKIENEGVKLVDLFNAGDLDLVIINGSLSTAISGEYVKRCLKKETMCVLSRRPALTAMGTVTQLADLRGQDLLLAPDYCPVTQEILRQRELFRHIRQVDYTATMLQLILQTDYLTILPAGMVAHLMLTTPELAGASLPDLPRRAVTAFAREQAVLDKVVAELLGDAKEA